MTLWLVKCFRCWSQGISISCVPQIMLPTWWNAWERQLCPAFSSSVYICFVGEVPPVFRAENYELGHLEPPPMSLSSGHPGCGEDRTLWQPIQCWAIQISWEPFLVRPPLCNHTLSWFCLWAAQASVCLSSQPPTSCFLQGSRSPVPLGLQFAIPLANYPYSLFLFLSSSVSDLLAFSTLPPKVRENKEEIPTNQFYSLSSKV